MMKRLSYYIMLLGIVFFTSCEDFLDQVPKHNLTLDNAVTDYSGAKNILNGMYSIVASNSAFGGATWCRLSSQGGFYSSYTANFNMAYKEGSNDMDGTWQALYSLVNSANAAIEAISNLAENKFPTPERKKEMLAEARCMRGWAYTNLFWLFGRWWDTDDSAYGILYRDKMANLSNLQVPRSSVGESYTKIFEDLDDAIANMPDFTTSRSLSRQMAQVLKAKILLYRGVMRGSTQDLKDALTLVETVKRDAPSSWQMESDIEAMYEVGWDSKEVLWARYLGDFASTTSYEFDYSYNIGYNNTYSDIATGWLKEDPRYEVVMDSARAPETWDTKMVFTPVKLYHGGRYDTKDAPYATYYFRYAELYLMESELKARLDDYSLEEALKPLNDMRACRTNPVLPALSPGSKQDLLRAIFREIWVEQFLENGSEYFASLRFINDTDASTAQNKPWIYTLKPDVNFTENQYCWPIPENERLKNPLAVQNPELGN